MPRAAWGIGIGLFIGGSVIALAWGRWEGVAFLLGGLGAFVAAVQAWERRRRHRTVRQVTLGLERLTRGEVPAHVHDPGDGPEADLARAYNTVVERVAYRMTALEEERNRLRAVLEHLADGILLADETGRVLWWNAAAARLLGFSPQAHKTLSIGTAVRHHRLIHVWQTAQRTREPQEETLEIDGGRRTLRVTVNPFRENHRRVYLLILQDITYIRRLETARRDFVSNISHELRTPLASLKAVVETLRDGALEDPEAAHRFLDHIEREVDALTQLVEELLELTRIESGQAPLRLTSVPVEAIVHPVSERFRPQAERARLTFTVEVPPALPPVLADPDRAQRILSNLVHNAIKFTPAGGRVTVRAWAEAEEVLFAVEDTGIGIPADRLPRIFERFYKVDQARSGEGTGLGLAIAKHLTLAHGGRIWAESEEGVGSTFYFSLRRADVS